MLPFWPHFRAIDQILYDFMCRNRRVIDFFDVSVSRYRLLESRLEETVQQTMKIKEEKISSLEKKVEETNTINTTLLAELATVRTCVQILTKKLFF